MWSILRDVANAVAPDTTEADGQIAVGRSEWDTEAATGHASQAASPTTSHLDDYEVPEGLPRPSSTRLTAEALRRLELARQVDTPSPSSMQLVNGRQDARTPSVTSQSEDENQGNVTVLSVKTWKKLNDEGDMTRSSSTEPMSTSNLAQVLNDTGMLDKTWDPATSSPPRNVKSTTKRYSLDKTSPNVTGRPMSSDSPVRKSNGLHGRADQVDERSIADKLPPEIILQVSNDGVHCNTATCE